MKRLWLTEEKKMSLCIVNEKRERKAEKPDVPVKCEELCLLHVQNICRKYAACVKVLRNITKMQKERENQ